MGRQELTLRITGKNSDGEYWLHIDGSAQSAGFNLGDPSGMISEAFLMAASGHTYTRLDSNTRIVTVAQLRKWASTVKTYTQDYTIDELGDDLFTLVEIRAIIGEVK